MLRLKGKWRTVAMFAAAGAALNVLETWVMATTFLPHRGRIGGSAQARMREERGDTWAHVRPASGAAPTTYFRSVGWSSTEDFAYWGFPQAKGTEHAAAVFAFGFPARSLECWYAGDVQSYGGVMPQQWHGAWRFNTDLAAATLPLIPMPGFLVNTALYAGAMWGVVAGTRGIVRWRRARRGGCARCGYDVTGVVGGRCPECGAVIGGAGAAGAVASGI